MVAALCKEGSSPVVVVACPIGIIAGDGVNVETALHLRKGPPCCVMCMPISMPQLHSYMLSTWAQYAAMLKYISIFLI